jgi:LmbE family N-acetylglucosaminyl deacetylase
MPASVLAVVAHPDDESFGLGALLSAASAAGARAGVLCLTHGEASTLHGVDGDLRDIREAELRAAAKRLGLCWVRLLDHPDGAVAADAAKVTADVAAAVDSFHPDVLLVFDPNGITGHPDHQAATRAAVAVGRRHDIDVVAWSLPASVTDVMADEGMPMFVGIPDAAVQVTVAVDRATQLEAVREHPSQAVPGSPLWRRLELLGDREHLRYLHSTGRAELPFAMPATTSKECTT